jgi:hypothetical protein
MVGLYDELVRHAAVSEDEIDWRLAAFAALRRATLQHLGADRPRADERPAGIARASSRFLKVSSLYGTVPDLVTADRRETAFGVFYPL